MKSLVGKCSSAFKSWMAMFIIILVIPLSNVCAQPVLFDFDNAPIHTSLPIYLTAGGITAHFTATGQGFSIQPANTMGFTPQGFAGLCIYPNSIYLADLLISFNQPITDFSIMYACQELGCDDAALMRVTAYQNGDSIGTRTKTARFPGTWPTDTLKCSFAQGFNSVVVHYAHRPPTCQDYGVIFMADNMWVTPMNTTVIFHPKIFIEAYYSGNGTMTAALDPINFPTLFDFITIELHDPVSPYGLAYSVTNTLDIYGDGSFEFPGTVLGNSYYVVIRHRNSIETWSKYPVLFNGSSVSFDCTTP